MTLSSSDQQSNTVMEHWLDETRSRLSRLSLEEHDAAIRSLIDDWSLRHFGAERLASNPAWEAFNQLLSEDRVADKDAVMNQ